MAKQQRAYSELKKRAMLAKQRMKMGYWQSLREEKIKILSEVGTSVVGQQFASEVQRAKYARDTNNVINRSQGNKDEQLYIKVCKILDEDEDATNPIGQLVDQEEYGRLDDAGRQRYILELSKKFREFKERYYRERIGKTC